jgi:hypothetical protein
MSENIYLRQESLGIQRDQKIVVVGCGGIGAWCGYFLGLAGVRELALFDGDEISEHNLNRLPFTPEDIGKPKSLALAALIRKARPETAIRAYGHFDFEVPSHCEAVSSANRVVCSTDSLRSRREVYKAVKGHPAGHLRQPEVDAIRAGRYIELGADGLGMSISGTPAEWASELEGQPGYTSVPQFVGPCAMAASMACYYILLDQPIRDTFRVDWKDGLQVRQYQEV